MNFGILCQVVPEVCIFFHSGVIAILDHLESRERYGLKAVQCPAATGYLALAHFN